MDLMLISAIGLLCVGLGLVVLEVFIPSGGILGVMAGITLIVAIVLAFLCGPWTGLSFIAIVIVALPLCLAAALHFWPNTPMGRRVLLKVPTSEDVLPDDPDRRRLKGLVGRIGRAKNVMLPSGAVLIGGQTVDAVSEGMAIESGQPVRVIEVRGNRVVVRPAEDGAGELATDLSQPIDAVGLNPFEDPLA